LGEGAAARAVVGAPVIAAVALMLVNDHVLKGSGLVPGLVTGKLSDFAFLFFAPIVLVFASRARSSYALVACYFAPVALYVAINVSPSASDAFARIMSHLFPMRLWPDLADLVALVSVPLSWRYLTRPAPASSTAKRASVARVLVTAIAAISCVATSPPPPKPTHRPLYMSWEELRGRAVQVLPPQPIKRRGKLLIAHQHLFISEPNQGVHVYDNRDPQNPVAVMFLRIPGNIDIAVQGHLLYADSFVDLLTFRLDLEKRTAKLIGRLEGQFAYDALQTLELGQAVRLEGVDQGRGVVIGVEPIGPQPGGAQE
jgi:hypothetical protein